MMHNSGIYLLVLVILFAAVVVAGGLAFKFDDVKFATSTLDFLKVVIGAALGFLGGGYSG